MMLFEKYDFTCCFETDAQLPFYKGSTFRGAFGRALKNVVCALKQQECNTCLLCATCVYSRVFEIPVSANAKDSRMAAPPHPFVIEPPLTPETRFPAGSSFDFSLLLIGEANTLLPYFIYAFEKMGKTGIGKKTDGKHGRFRLENVNCGRQPVYSSADHKLTRTDPVKNLNLNPLPKSEATDLCLRLTLMTPLRLKSCNRLQADLPFHLLVRAMLRRISSLMNAYGDGEPALDYPGLVKKAEIVRTVAKDLSWFDWQRYSSRQDEKMLMGGMTGTVTYEGPISEYLPLIEFCEQVHLGKQTTFGLGKIKSEVIP